MRRLSPVVLLIFFSCSLISCGNRDDSLSARDAQVSPTPPEVLVHEVIDGPISKTYTAVGTVAASDIARIMPKVSGRIKTIHADEGCSVTRGDQLMLIDPFDYEQAYENTLAVKNQAQATLERATRDLERMKSLFDQKSVSQQTYQDALTARDLARYQLDQSSVSLETAGRNLRECSVSAPISGIVTDKFVNEGELTAPSQLAFVIMKMDTVKVEVDLPEEIFGLIRHGNTGLITIDAIPDKPFTGTITKIYPTIDPMSRTFRVTITLDNPHLLVRSGMTARARVIQKARQTALSVPKSSLVQGEEGYFIYKLDNDTVKKTLVQLGIEGDSAFEITHGVSSGDRVVIKGIAGLTDGMRVKIAGEAPARGE